MVVWRKPKSAGKAGEGLGGWQMLENGGVARHLTVEGAARRSLGAQVICSVRFCNYSSTIPKTFPQYQAIKCAVTIATLLSRLWLPPQGQWPARPLEQFEKHASTGPTGA